MSGILFVSSHNTGHGHKSITEALREQISFMDPSVKIVDIDGFRLSGKINGFMSRMYDRFAVNIPLVWKYYYQLGNIYPGVASKYMTKSVRSGLVELIEQHQPDLVVSVHPCFVSPVEEVIAGMGLEIPVVSLIADLDNVSRMWADKRTFCTLCPTINAKRTMLRYGVPEEKTAVTGFPIRDRFNHFIPEEGTSYYQREFYQKRLKVRHWKKFLPELSDFVKNVFPKKQIKEFSKDYLQKYLLENCKSELTHWCIIFSSLLFLLWAEFEDSGLIIIIALILNLPYIIIQRYNRPRIIDAVESIDIHSKKVLA